MKRGIPFEEAKQQRDEREKLEHPQPEPKKPNGADATARELQLVGWHEVQPAEGQTQLVLGLLGDNQLAVLYGESASGKSFLAFDMSAHFALRREWLGHRVAGGGVLYIAAEGRGGWANRVEAFCQHHKIDEEQRAMVPFAFIMQTINLGRNGGGDVGAVILAAKRAQERWEEPARLIVVDTVARAMPGSNENDPVDMGSFVSHMDEIREATKATLVGVHHSGKNTSLGARGHSSLRAAVDCELEVERTNKQRLLRVRKSRDGIDGATQAFQLLPVEIGRDGDEQPITSCVVQSAAVAAEEAKTRRRASDAEKLLMTVFHQSLNWQGVELQLPDGGPRVKAVNQQYVRNIYVQRRGGLEPEDAKRVFNRALGKALGTEAILSRQMDETVWLFSPSKQ